MKKFINWHETAEIYSDAGMYEEAVACYDRELEINPENINALENKGVCLLELNRDQESMECFDKAVEIGEEKSRIFFDRGVELKNKGQYWEALISIDQGLDFFPFDEDALQCVDSILDKLIKTEKME